MSILRTWLHKPASRMELYQLNTKALQYSRAIPQLHLEEHRNLLVDKIHIISQQESAMSCLNNLNNLFLDSYSIRKEHIKKALGVITPVILMNGDNLILLHQKKRKVIKYIPDLYHALKSIAHISCLIHTLHNLKDHPLKCREAIRVKCRENLEQITQLPTELSKYTPLLEEYMRFLKKEEVIEDVSELSQLKGALNNLIGDAAKCRIDSLHKYVKEIRQEIGEEQWRNLSVVVMGPAMPRQGELSMQYFSSVLKENCPHSKESLTGSKKILEEGGRVIYAEAIDKEWQALDLLVTHLCDEALGKDIMGNPQIMQGDVLQNSTRQYLTLLEE